RCCGGGALDERLDLEVVAVADEPATGHDHTEVDRRKDGQGGDHGTDQPANEVADQGGGDDDGAGGDKAHGHGVEELALGQPVVLVNDAFSQEGDDGEPAAEDEGPGFEEEQPQGDLGPRTGGQATEGPEHRGGRPERRVAPAEKGGRGVQDDHQQPGPDEQQRDLGAGE